MPPIMNRLLAILALLAACCWPASAWADEAKSANAGPPDYVRYAEDESGSRLLTGIGRFQNASGIQADLIGAVHIADKKYFDQLNALFKSYDAVLYELVGPPMAERLKQKKENEGEGGGRLQWIGSLQEMMKKTLGLTGQLEGIDYTAKNFVHADMRTGEFFETQEQKGESFLGLWARAWKAQMEIASTSDRTNQPGLARLLQILCSENSSAELKRLVGREFDEVEKLIAGVEGDSGTVLIGERNRVAIEALAVEMAKGRKRLAIFFGAAHLPDMEKRLARMGFKKTKTDWLTAWDMPAEVTGSGFGVQGSDGAKTGETKGTIREKATDSPAVKAK